MNIQWYVGVSQMEKTQPYRMKVDIFKGIILKVFFTMSKICEKVQCSYYFISNLFSTFYNIQKFHVCKYCLILNQRKI